MAAKRKNPAQPELPIDGAPPPASNSPAPGGTGNGAQHVQAEHVEAPTRAAFVPGKIDLPLHRRVDRSFLDYASYVIRDRAIPHLIDGLKPVQRRILWTLHEKDDLRQVADAALGIEHAGLLAARGAVTNEFHDCLLKMRREIRRHP